MAIFNSYVKLPEGKPSDLCGAQLSQLWLVPKTPKLPYGRCGPDSQATHAKSKSVLMMRKVDRMLSLGFFQNV